MAKADTASARAPRGSKPVSQAFFAALDTVPEVRRAEIAKAAQIMIRDELKIRRDRTKATAAALKEKTRKLAPAARVAKAAAKPAPAAKPVAAKAPAAQPAAAKAAAPAKAPAVVKPTAVKASAPAKKTPKPRRQPEPKPESEPAS
jgi:hypothetical protein